MSDFVQQNSTSIEFITDDSWTILNNIEKSIKNKIEKVGIPLKEWNVQINYGIKTGLNEAFIIPSERRNEILSHCLTEDEKKRTEQIIRPILRGRDIKRYSTTFCDLYVILAYFGFHKVAESQYPSLFEYLKQFEAKLKERGQCQYSRTGSENSGKDYKGQHHWLELDNNPSLEKLDDFNKPKILYREISSDMGACYEEKAMYINNKAYFIIGEHLIWLCCFFNSSIFKKFIFSSFNQTGGKGPDTLLNIRVPKPSLLQENSLIKLYNSLMDSDDNIQRKEIEDKIDEFFYKVFNLSDSQIDFISEEKS